MTSKVWLAACLLGCSVLAAPTAMAAGGIKTQQVQFKKGESGATIKGKIKGGQTLDYTLAAQKGQTMVVILEGHPYFNVLPPGSKGEAIFIGSSEGNRFETTLPTPGKYTIRVYQMGDAADSGKTNSFKLDIGISGLDR